MAKLVLLLERVKNDPLKGAALAGALDGFFDQLLSGANPALASHLDSVIAGNEALSGDPAAADAWAAALATAEQPGGWTVVVGRDGKIVGFNKLGPDGRPVRPTPPARSQQTATGGDVQDPQAAPQATPQPPRAGARTQRPPDPNPATSTTTTQVPVVPPPTDAPHRRQWGG